MNWLWIPSATLIALNINRDIKDQHFYGSLTNINRMMFDVYGSILHSDRDDDFFGDRLMVGHRTLTATV